MRKSLNLIREPLRAHAQLAYKRVAKVNGSREVRHLQLSVGVGRTQHSVQDAFDHKHSLSGFARE